MECALGQYGGRPSPGVCQLCPKYDGPARGLGDVVDKITTAIGIKAVVKLASKITGKPCNCEKRRQKLNQLLPNE